MKTIPNLYRQLLSFLRFGQEVIHYVLIFVSAFFRNRASLGCELVAIRSQLTFFPETPPKRCGKIAALSCRSFDDLES